MKSQLMQAALISSIVLLALKIIGASISMLIVLTPLLVAGLTIIVTFGVMTFIYQTTAWKEVIE